MIKRLLSLIFNKVIIEKNYDIYNTTFYYSGNKYARVVSLPPKCKDGEIAFTVKYILLPGSYQLKSMDLPFKNFLKEEDISNEFLKNKKIDRREI